MELIDKKQLMNLLGITENCDDCQYQQNAIFCRKGSEFTYVCDVLEDIPSFKTLMGFDIDDLTALATALKKHGIAPSYVHDWHQMLSNLIEMSVVVVKEDILNDIKEAFKNFESVVLPNDTKEALKKIES